MNDREFRRRAHALLKKHSGGALIDENGRCVECGGVEGTWEFKHKDGCELVALIAAGPDHETCDCLYPPAHRPECPVIRERNLRVQDGAK